MRDHGPSIKPRAVFLVILVVSLVAVDAIGPGRTASAWAAPTRRGIGHRAPGSPGSSLRRVERHLDSSRWGWREARIKVRIGFHPGDCCHRGIFDFPNRTMWIGPSAFRTDRLLRYIVLHELAHRWQSVSTRWQTVRPDMRRWGRSGISAFEAIADCIAAIWGAGRGHYWNVPPTPGPSPPAVWPTTGVEPFIPTVPHLDATQRPMRPALGGALPGDTAGSLFALVTNIGRRARTRSAYHSASA